MLKTILFTCIFSVISIISFAQNSYRKEGKATYYSNRMHGHRTSSGERYNKNLNTAAHATLPLGTLVKVTNVKTNKSTIVKINDRCAKSSSRIIDLSMSAAKELDMVGAGIINVVVEEIVDTKTVEAPADPLIVKDTIVKPN